MNYPASINEYKDADYANYTDTRVYGKELKIEAEPIAIGFEEFKPKRN
jgi:hypothetical protein